jgi:hypothetical protein
LDNILSKRPDLQCILGGDWNLTPSPLPADSNPDVLNMKKIPNEAHTRLLQKIQLKYKLVDAFRILHPNRNDYSYIPWSEDKTNRSRIDFVLISSNLTPLLTECSIAHHLQCRLVDHKATFTSFIPIKRFSRIDTITQKTTNDPLTEHVVKIAYFETLLLHVDKGQASIRNIDLTALLGLAGRGQLLLRYCASLLHSQDFLSPDDEAQYDYNLANIRDIILSFEELNLENLIL